MRDGREVKERVVKRSSPKSTNLEKYIDQVANPIEYVLSGMDPQRNPNSAGTTTFLGAYVSTEEVVANAPYYDSTGLSETTTGCLMVATNGVSQERFLTSATADATGIVQIEGEFVSSVTNQTNVAVDGSFTGLKDNYVEGVFMTSKNLTQTEQYVASLPLLYDRPCWLFTWNASASTTCTFKVRCPRYMGNVQFRLQGYNTSSSSWSALAAVVPKGEPGGSATFTLDNTSNVNALSLSVISNAQQEIDFQCTIYSGADTGSFTVPRHTNLLTPKSVQFDSEINSNALREYWPCAAGEVISNKTAILTKGGTAYAVSTQRFAGLYNASGASNMVELITKNKIHYYSGAGSDGLSGHMVPRAFQPEPSPFSFRGFGSDCRIYLVLNPIATPQEFNIQYSTIIAGLGKRTGSIAYGVTSYPPWWTLVVESLVFVNPMSCNPDHDNMFKRALSAVRNFIKSPENVEKIINGAISAADLAHIALDSSFPRVAGAAGQVSYGLNQLKGFL